MLHELARLIGSIMLCIPLLAGPVAAQALPRLLDSGNRLGEVHVFPADGEASSVALLLSGKDGWTDRLGEIARTLARDGVIVAGIDLSAVLAHAAQGETDCIYLVSDLEALSKQLQHALGRDRYLSPVLIAAGAGGTLAYASLAQAPAATLAGAVVVDPAPSLDTSLPFCAGAPSTGNPGDYRYGAVAQLPGFLTILVHRGQPYPRDWLAGGRATAVELGRHQSIAAVAAAITAALQEAASGAADAGATLDDLPIIELPAAPTTPFLAVILSGDGGWRDLDKTIGEWLADHGVAVIGLDSLRYFWTARLPERIGSDVTRIVRHYMAAWDRKKLVLVGYSFGAGVLPAAIGHLPPDVTAALVEVSLLGIARQADFEFHMTGWLGDVSDEAQPTAPAFARLPSSMVQCFYGDEEEDSLCEDPIAATTQRVRTSGGHHFDGDYARLAGLILAGAVRRAEAR